jgi:hypothetical protein
MSSMANQPCVHHHEHLIARFFCGIELALFALFDQHENLQVSRRTSACERAGDRVVDRGAKTQGRQSAMD